MNSIIYDDEIIILKYKMWKYYNNFTKKLNARDCVKLSLFCAKIANDNSKESNLCIGLVEKWLIDEKSVSKQELWDASASAVYYAANVANVVSTSASASASAANAASTVYYAADAAYTYVSNAASTVYYAAVASNASNASIDIINKYLQILLRKTKQFQNNKILEQISKTDVDKLELVDWNMITDIMLEEYNIVHDFSYEDIFSRRCLIELLRREYT